MIRNYRDLTRLEMENIDRENTLVMIPLGALEQHGNQAPLGTDDIIAEQMCKEVTKQLKEKDSGFPLLIFPVIPVGLSTEHKNFCGSITFRPDTYYKILSEIVESLVRHGFKKIVFLVCHGGNAPIASLLSREARSDYGIEVFQISSGAFSDPRVMATISEGNTFDFHGGEMETSMVMAVDESIVHLETSKAGHKTGFVFDRVLSKNNASMNWVSEDWVDDDGKPIGIGGDPKGATAQKGKIIYEVSAEYIVNALLHIAGRDNI